MVTITRDPVLTGWTITKSVSGSTTTYVAKAKIATSYGTSPLPFIISVQQASGVQTAYSSPDLMAITCSYQSYRNYTLSVGSTNNAFIEALTTSANTNGLDTITACPTMAPTTGESVP